MVKVTAAILAGGLGTRLRSALPDKPKALAEVCGRPFLAYLLDQIAGAGVRDVVLCTGYLGEQVRAMVGESYGRLRIIYSQESAPLGTGGALRLALPLLKSDTVLVMNGDSFCDLDLRAFWDWHCAHDAEVTLALVKMTGTKRYGRVNVNADGLVMNFDEKGNEGGIGWINAGVYLLARSMIAKIPENLAVSLEKEMFPAWIGQGLRVYGYQSDGCFLDIGTPETYAEAEQFFVSEKP